MDDKKLIICPKSAKGGGGYRTFSIRIKEDVVDQINAVSARTGYSRNELIGKFLEYALAQCTILENGSKDKEYSSEN